MAARPRGGAARANRSSTENGSYPCQARPMAEQDRPIWELDFSLQDLNVSALGSRAAKETTPRKVPNCGQAHARSINRACRYIGGLLNCP